MDAHPFALMIAGLALAIPQTAAVAKGFDAKLWNGKWQLNLTKSKFSSPDYSSKSDKRTYTVAGDRVTMRADTVNAKGKSIKWGYSAVANGKPYPSSGNPNIDHIALTSVGPGEFKSEGQLKGKTVSKSTASVAGMELTIHRTIVGAKGGPTNDILVYERVK